jgi:hypothetical protein
MAFLACVLVTLGFAEERGRPWSVGTHVATTAGLIVGTLALVALLMDSGTLPGLAGIAYAFSVLGIRMDLSNGRHRQVCTTCGVECARRPASRGMDAMDVPSATMEPTRLEGSLQP